MIVPKLYLAKKKTNLEFSGFVFFLLGAEGGTCKERSDGIASKRVASRASVTISVILTLTAKRESSEK